MQKFVIERYKKGWAVFNRRARELMFAGSFSEAAAKLDQYNKPAVDFCI